MTKETQHPFFTSDMKLQALASKYYGGLNWEPKAGDYYTTSRADLELYQVVEVTDTKVKTRYLKPDSDITEWDKSGFTTEGFGDRRVYVPDSILSTGFSNILDHANEYAKTICAKFPEQRGDTELILQQLIIKAKTGQI